MKKKVTYNPFTGKFDIITVESTVSESDIEEAIEAKSEILDGYTYMGMAEQNTVPDTTQGKVYYLAWGLERGVYVNFDELNFPTTSLCALMWNEQEWSYEEIIDVSAYNDSISGLPPLPTVSKHGDEIAVARQGFGEQKYKYDLGRMQVCVESWDELVQALSSADDSIKIFCSTPIVAPTIEHTASTYTEWNINPNVKDIIISGQPIKDIWQLKITSLNRTKELNIRFDNEVSFVVIFNPYGGTTIAYPITTNVDKACNIYNYYSHVVVGTITNLASPTLHIHGRFVTTYVSEALISSTVGSVTIHKNYVYSMIGGEISRAIANLFSYKGECEYAELPEDETTYGTYKVTDRNGNIPAGTHYYYDGEKWQPIIGELAGYFSSLSVGFARDITPNEGDAIVDNSAFVWQTSGGEVSIAGSSTGILKRITGNIVLSVGEDDGKRKPFTATHIVSRGTNLFNYQDEAKRIVGKKLNSDGTITNDSSYTLFFVNVLQGVDGGNNGYVPVVKSGETLSGIGFEYLGFQIPQPTDETDEVTILTRGTHGNASTYIAPDNGWIVFSLLTEKQDCLSIQFAWSYGESQFSFVEYEESVLNLPSVCSEYGLYGIGSVCDEINNDGKYIKRIGVVNTADLQWTRWTQTVYNPSTQSGEEQFMGYKTSSLSSVIKRNTTTITHDTISHLRNAQTDDNGVLYFTADYEDPEVLAQLTDGVNLMYELAQYETSDVAFNGLLNVWDFGDMHIFGTTIYSENPYTGLAQHIPPYSVTFLYSVNLRDVLRGIAKSGATFDPTGITTGGVFKSSDVSNVNVSGTLVLSDIKKMMKFTLTGSNNTIILPNIQTLKSNAFSCQFKIVQDSTGGRNLYIVMDDGNGSTVSVKNPSEFDFSTGEANQSCVATLLYDGDGTWWFESTRYVE